MFFELMFDHFETVRQRQHGSLRAYPQRGLPQLEG
jgi:hypothetical protein